MIMDDQVPVKQELLDHSEAALQNAENVRLNAEYILENASMIRDEIEHHHPMIMDQDQVPVKNELLEPSQNVIELEPFNSHCDDYDNKDDNYFDPGEMLQGEHRITNAMSQ
jgi:hypothetical protein